MGVPLFVVLAVCVTLLDQLTKAWALAAMPRYEPVTIVPGFFQLTFSTNTGAAFGMLSNATPILALIALAAAIAITVVGVRGARTMPHLQSGALALVLGGCMGNFIDRAFRHYVVDFFDVFVSTHHWPIFNVADSSICVGVGILMVLMSRDSNRSSKPLANDGGTITVDAEQSAPISK
ncbi:MAG TPA: signal peptidase II [Capsulimonadaceae bacterium]|jgi:signal peptidase II